jgi:hypothetical protein
MQPITRTTRVDRIERRNGRARDLVIAQAMRAALNRRRAAAEMRERR